MEPDRDQRPLPSSTAAAPPPADAGAVLRFSGLTRLALVWGGVIVPVECFLTAIYLGDWDPSGSVGRMAWSLLVPPAAVAHYPLLLFNIVCMLLLVVDPEYYGRRRLTRYGIYSGVAYALEYSVVVLATIESGIGSAGLGLVVMFIVMLPAVAFLYFLVWTFGKAVVALGKVPSLLAIIPGLLVLLFGVIGIVPLVLVSLPLGPTMSLVAYGAVSLALLRWRRAQGIRFRYSLAEMCGLTAWWSVHLAVWRISFMLARSAAGHG